MSLLDNIPIYIFNILLIFSMINASMYSYENQSRVGSRAMTNIESLIELENIFNMPISKVFYLLIKLIYYIFITCVFSLIIVLYHWNDRDGKTICILTIGMSIIIVLCILILIYIDKYYTYKTVDDDDNTSPETLFNTLQTIISNNLKFIFVFQAHLFFYLLVMGFTVLFFNLDKFETIKEVTSSNVNTENVKSIISKFTNSKSPISNITKIESMLGNSYFNGIIRKYLIYNSLLLISLTLIQYGFYMTSKKGITSDKDKKQIKTKSYYIIIMYYIIYLISNLSNISS